VKRKSGLTWAVINLGCCLYSLSLAAQTAKPKTLYFVADIFPLLVEDLGSGKICGLAPFLTKATVEAIGYRYELEIQPLARALKAMETGTKDGIISVYKSDERKKFLNFVSNPFYNDVVRVFSRSGQPIPWNGTMESLRPFRIGVMQGWYYIDRLKALKLQDPQYRFEWVPLRESGFKMLRAGRIDVLMSNDRNYKNFLLKDKGGFAKAVEIKPLEPPFESKGVFVGFAKKVPAELVQAFDKTMNQLLKDPAFQKSLEASPLPCPKP
jgi:polar amino acid transport system substrate-binding protein